MRFVDVIRKKRDRLPLSTDEIQFVVDSVTARSVPDYQISALLMAIYLNGMTTSERSALTRAMTHSGRVLALGHIPEKKVDKHSTGGIGDKISICLAPAVAACGVAVPMVSGRGLGHTGGTLDKLEAIPGLVTRLESARFVEILEKAGLVMGGQSGDIAPADKILYALRDVTSTVESLPLIASSIMSKKLAEGIDGLVLDVKVGAGAFMKTADKARELAVALVELGLGVGVKTTAFLTDMDQPLGLTIGNANETAEALEVLKGGGPADIVELTAILGGEMLVLGGVAKDLEDGKAKIRASLQDGSALARMRMLIALQGGDPRVCDDPSLLPQPAHRAIVTADRAGYVAGFDSEELGRIVIALGGGRNVAEDTVDPSVGIWLLQKRGAAVDVGTPLAEIGAADPASLRTACDTFLRSISLADLPPPPAPLIIEIVRL